MPESDKELDKERLSIKCMSAVFSFVTIGGDGWTVTFSRRCDSDPWAAEIIGGVGRRLTSNSPTLKPTKRLAKLLVQSILDEAV